MRTASLVFELDGTLSDPAAGIAAALEHLSSARVTMGVCTSKRADFAERILEMFDLRQILEVPAELTCFIPN